MLAIGRILRTGARLLLLDEPTEGLAPVIIQQIGKTIGMLKQQGFTILLVEQNFRFAATVADRYYVMEHGRIIDRFANSELEANLGKLHDYLGVWKYPSENPRLADLCQQKQQRERSVAMKRLHRPGGADRAVRVRRRARADHRQDRRAHRHVEPLLRSRRRRLGGGRQARGRGFRRRQQGHEGRDHLRRPPEQAGRRLEHCQSMVRRRQGRHDRRHAEFRRGARGERDRPAEEQGLHRLRRGGLRPHRPQVQRQHRPLDLRHLDAGQRHRQGAGEDRRRHLVLPHRRLRLRPRARARHRGGGRGERRQGARQGAPSAQHQRLLLVPAAGAVVEGEGHRARQCRRRHHQRDQAGRRVRHRQGRPELRRPAGVRQRRRTRSACRPPRA